MQTIIHFLKFIFQQLEEIAEITVWQTKTKIRELTMVSKQPLSQEK